MLTCTNNIRHCHQDTIIYVYKCGSGGLMNKELSSIKSLHFTTKTKSMLSEASRWLTDDRGTDFSWGVDAPRPTTPRLATPGAAGQLQAVVQSCFGCLDRARRLIVLCTKAHRKYSAQCPQLRRPSGWFLSGLQPAMKNPLVNTSQVLQSLGGLEATCMVSLII